MTTVAALFVDPKGPYIGLEGVDPWPEERDARLYNEVYAVVAHPPCARWSSLAPLVEATHGIPRGEDGGLFASALDTVRRCGGVLEHPAQSAAWLAHRLTAPPPGGGWVRAGLWDEPGWTCCVAQRNYGHRARKRTWLYAVGCELPSMTWGDGPEPELWLTAGAPWRSRPGETMQGVERIHTPELFRDLLLSMARSAAS